MPLTTTELIVDGLNDHLSDVGIDLEVYTDFPSDELVTSEGLYVARFYQESRTKFVETMGTGGSAYEVVDRLELYFINGQGNTYVDATLNAVSDFVDNALFVEYHIREYTVEQLYRNNNESYRIIFSLTRLQTL